MSSTYPDESRRGRARDARKAGKTTPSSPTTYPDESRRGANRDREGNRGRRVASDGRKGTAPVVPSKQNPPSPDETARLNKRLARRARRQDARQAKQAHEDRQQARQDAKDAQEAQLASQQNYYDQALKQQRQANRAQRQQNRAARKDFRQQQAANRNSVYADMASRFAEYGLNGKEVMQALKGMPNGWENSTAKMVEVVRGTKTWQKEFGSVFEARKKAGYSSLTEGDIVNLRSDYKKALKDYLPKGFYNNDRDMDRFIAANISVDEIESRAKIAYDFAEGRDPNQRQALRQFYGIGSKELAAYFLDPDKALPDLQKKADIAVLGGKMLDSKLKIGDAKDFASELYGKGIDQDTAQAAFQRTAETKNDWNRVNALDGGDGWTDRQLAESELGTNTNVSRRKKSAASRERARFSGSAGGTDTFARSTSGSF